MRKVQASTRATRAVPSEEGSLGHLPFCWSHPREDPGAWGLSHTHHHDLGARAQGHLVGRGARGDSVNEDAREVPADDTYLLQQCVALESQHHDLALSLAGWPPPHRHTAAGREGQVLCALEQAVRPGPLPLAPPLAQHSGILLPQHQKGCHLPKVIGHSSLLCHLLALAPPSAHLAER